MKGVNHGLHTTHTSIIGENLWCMCFLMAKLTEVPAEAPNYWAGADKGIPGPLYRGTQDMYSAALAQPIYEIGTKALPPVESNTKSVPC